MNKNNFRIIFFELIKFSVFLFFCLNLNFFANIDTFFVKLNNFLIFLNYFSVFCLALFFYSDFKIINFFVAVFLSIILSLESYSFYFFGSEINNTFLVNLFDVNFLFNAFKMRFFLCCFGIFLFVALFSALFFLIQKIDVKNKIIKFSVISLPIFFLFSPFGFFNRIYNIIKTDFVVDVFKYRNFDYQDISAKFFGKKYIIKDEIVASFNEEKKKNIIIIYLESFESAYLFNEKLKNYTNNIKNLSKDGEFYYDIPQITNANYTVSAIFTTMCGITYNVYPIFGSFLKDNENKNFVCLPHVLKKAGYNQIYLGGANGKAFSKNNLLKMFEYDKIEDFKTIKNKNQTFPESFWGIYDKELFEIAKEEFVKLSKDKKPFNLTLLTLATHNSDGVSDKRCKNSNKIGLVNAIECTDYLLNDFINFLKKQPNYKDTLIVIMPDHIQYNENSLKNIINKEEKKLWVLILNSETKNENDRQILYTDLSELLLKKLGIEHNANFIMSNIEELDFDKKINFVNSQEANNLARIFLFKLFKK